MRKPTLNKRTVSLLRGLIVYAKAESDLISDGTEDQKKEADDIRAACEWLNKLCKWHDYETSKTRTR